MKSPTPLLNRWSAWTRSRSRCTPTSDLRFPLPLAGWRNGTTSTNDRHGQCLLRRGAESRSAFHPAHPQPLRAEFAQALETVVRSYPGARKIHLVMDNLISTAGNPSRLFRRGEGGSIWGRLTVHYTPKHGSWLNQAEIEISLFSRQCLGKRRIPTLRTLRRESRAWNRQVNRHRVKINWQFTRKRARAQFGYNRNLFRRSKT